MPDKEVNVNLPLKGELLKKASQLKEDYGLETYTELMRMLITQRHKELFGSKSP
jgi:hypothetical protein